jgi:hypothetical protein
MTKLKVHVGDFPTGKKSQFLNGIFFRDAGKIAYNPLREFMKTWLLTIKCNFKVSAYHGQT